MKIIVFGEYLFEGMAGTNRIRTLLDPLIKDKKIEVLNIVYYHPSDKKSINALVDYFEGIKYSYIEISGKNLFSFIKIVLRSANYLNKWGKDSKELIFYNYGYPDIISILIILTAKILRYKVIFDIVENNWVIDQNTNIYFKLRMKSSLFLIKMIGLYANGCIVISKSLLDLLRKYTKSKCPIALIPISVDTNKFKYVKSGASKGSINVFWGGSIAFAEDWSSTKDGIIELLKAFDQTCRKNTFLTITGSGDSKSIEKFNYFLSQCENNAHIKYTGFVTSTEYCKLLSECDIAIMNRVNTKYANYGFPFKLGEYLASGKAIIATQVGDIELYLKNNINAILIPPSDSLSLSEALIKLYDNPQLRIDLGINGRILAENSFSSNSNSSNFYNFLNKLR